MRFLIPFLAVLALALTPVHAAEITPGTKIAFFGITFIDTSTEGAYNGVREDEQIRLKMLEDYVRAQLKDRGFTLVDLAPVQKTIDRTTNTADCNYCDVLMARELQADYAMVGEVQKVSNLILSMNLVVRDAPNGQFVRGMSVDIRGNNDDSWLRGARYILKNNIFRK